jgi:hypothetical protein
MMSAEVHAGGIPSAEAQSQRGIIMPNSVRNVIGVRTLTPYTLLPKTWAKSVISEVIKYAASTPKAEKITGLSFVTGKTIGLSMTISDGTKSSLL